MVTVSPSCNRPRPAPVSTRTLNQLVSLSAEPAHWSLISFRLITDYSTLSMLRPSVSWWSCGPFDDSGTYWLWIIKLVDLYLHYYLASSRTVSVLPSDWVTASPIHHIFLSLFIHVFFYSPTPWCQRMESSSQLTSQLTSLICNMEHPEVSDVRLCVLMCVLCSGALQAGL